MFAYANLEIAETSYWGLKKKVLTENGGRTSNFENLLNEEGDIPRIKKSASSLTFRIKNNNQKGFDDGPIAMKPPLVRVINEAEQVVYPVLKGRGARGLPLETGESTELKLEFNCVSMDENYATVEVEFRPSYHTAYRFRINKE